MKLPEGIEYPVAVIMPGRIEFFDKLWLAHNWLASARAFRPGRPVEPYTVIALDRGASDPAGCAGRSDAPKEAS